MVQQILDTNGFFSDEVTYVIGDRGYPYKLCVQTPRKLYWMRLDDTCHHGLVSGEYRTIKDALVAAIEREHAVYMCDNAVDLFCITNLIRRCTL